MSVTKYPVRSTPYGYGTGVVKPNAEIEPTGVKINCEKVVLGVGVTCVTTFFDGNEAVKVLWRDVNVRCVVLRRNRHVTRLSDHQ